MGEPIIGSPIRSVDTFEGREARLRILAGVSAKEALAAAQSAQFRRSVPVFWCSASPGRPGFDVMPPSAREEWLEQVERTKLGDPWIDVAAGHSAGLLALSAARDALASGRYDACLIVGVDSMLNMRTVRWMEEAGRQKTESNSDGVIPGECASCVVVERAQDANRRGVEIWARIIGLGVGHEPNSQLSNRPSRADGLSDAIRTALKEARIHGPELRDVFCDLNGEAFRAREWILAMIRSIPGYSSDMEVIHAADCLGDVGAASGPLMLAYSAASLRLGYSPSSEVLLWSASDDHHRGAAVVAATEPERYVPAGAMPVVRSQNSELRAPPAMVIDGARSTLVQQVAGFREALHAEHLEEAGFLCEQRHSLLDDAELSWIEIGAFERRMLRHTDALALEGASASAALNAGLQADDAGEAYAAALAMLCMNDDESSARVVERLGTGSEQVIGAVIEAIVATPREAIALVRRLLLESSAPAARTAACRLAGFRRLPLELDDLPLAEAVVESEVMLWALGRTSARDAQGVLSDALRDSAPALRRTASIALLRLGVYDSVIKTAMRVAEPWADMALGLAGGPDATSLLLERYAGERRTADTAIALGLLGDIRAVGPLIASLVEQPVAADAAIALELITGAGLYEEVFVPDDDEAERIDDERQDEIDASGKVALVAQTGVSRRQLAITPELWFAWWKANHGRFASRIRFRNGQPYSPARLLASLRSEKSPRVVRALAYEELVIRYHADVEFETEMFVAEQERALSAYAPLIDRLESECAPGRWYFAGHELRT
ncbi:MAG: beta-ketoacyl synthase N-terminal-like domain-containing protein [Gemmatimonadaceae bacterium]